MLSFFLSYTFLDCFCLLLLSISSSNYLSQYFSLKSAGSWVFYSSLFATILWISSYRLRDIHRNRSAVLGYNSQRSLRVPSSQHIKKVLNAFISACFFFPIFKAEILDFWVEFLNLIKDSYRILSCGGSIFTLNPNFKLYINWLSPNQDPVRSCITGNLFL